MAKRDRYGKKDAMIGKGVGEWLTRTENCQFATYIMINHEKQAWRHGGAGEGGNSSPIPNFVCLLFFACQLSGQSC